MEEHPIAASIHALPARRAAPVRRWRREMLVDVLPVALAVRLFFILATLVIGPWRHAVGLAPLILHPATGTALDNWNRWDTIWYDDLARLGYNMRGPNGYTNVAFFPLYPLLTRTLHDAVAFVGHSVLGIAMPDAYWPPYIIPAMIVSNVCAIAALLFFYTFLRLDHDRAVARRAVTLLALSPMALYLFAAYSEGTFLLCAIAFFYALRLERWWQAGLWGLLAGATRAPGALLLVPFLMAWAQAHPGVVRAGMSRLRLFGRALSARPRAMRAWRRFSLASLASLASRRPVTATPVLAVQALEDRTARRRAGDAGDIGSIDVGPMVEGTPLNVVRSRSRPWPRGTWRALYDAAPALIIPLGLGLFMLFLDRVFHNPLLFSTIQKSWLRTFAPPWETLVISVTWPLGDVLAGRPTATDGVAIHDLVYEVIGLALTWLAWKRLPRVQSVYLWLVWLTILCSPSMLTDRHTGEPHHDVLMSLPRLLLMMFPLYTLLALWRRAYVPLLIAFAILCAGYMGVFLTGGWLA